MEETPEQSQANAQIRYKEFVVRFPKKLAAKEEAAVMRFTGHKGNVLSKLRDLYAFTDELMAEAAPHTACKKGGIGCNACCYYAVSISEPEMMLIEQETRNKRLAKPTAGLHFHGKPCPFLIDGACSIYSVRPIRCRTHVTFDLTSYWCDPSRQMAVTMPQLRFSEIEKVFDSLRVGLPVLDIRQAFASVSNTTKL